MRAVLIMAFHTKGGVSEWLETDADEFSSWLKELRELTKHGKR